MLQPTFPLLPLVFSKFPLKGNQLSLDGTSFKNVLSSDYHDKDDSSSSCVNIAFKFMHFVQLIIRARQIGLGPKCQRLRDYCGFIPSFNGTGLGGGRRIIAIYLRQRRIVINRVH